MVNSLVQTYSSKGQVVKSHTNSNSKTTKKHQPRDSYYVKTIYGDFPGSPVVRTPCSHAHGLGPIPGQGTGFRQLRLGVVKINNKNK